MNGKWFFCCVDRVDRILRGYRAEYVARVPRSLGVPTRRGLGDRAAVLALKANHLGWVLGHAKPPTRLLRSIPLPSRPVACHGRCYGEFDRQ